MCVYYIKYGGLNTKHKEKLSPEELANWRSACGHAGICPKCGGLAYQTWEDLSKIECSKCNWTGDGKEGGYEGSSGEV